MVDDRSIGRSTNDERRFSKKRKNKLTSLGIYVCVCVAAAMLASQQAAAVAASVISPFPPK